MLHGQAVSVDVAAAALEDLVTTELEPGEEVRQDLHRSSFRTVKKPLAAAWRIVPVRVCQPGKAPAVCHVTSSARVPAQIERSTEPWMPATRPAGVYWWKS